MRSLIAAALLTAFSWSPAGAAGVPEYGYEVVHVYRHDRAAFTEGLLYLNGFLYESTGLDKGRSSVRKVKLETGEVLQLHQVPDQYFGEGIVNWKDKLYQLTWQSHIGFVYDLATFQTKSQFSYPGEGWAFTTDGKQIYMDDGTAQIRIWDPESLRETGRITVTDQGKPVDQLNELEWVKGEIYANIWETNRIARIDPKSGKVVGWIDLTGLLPASDIDPDNTEESVLNGIAYDAVHDRLFVTGKCWPKLFEIRLVKKGTR
jgi:glutaminyl-peptide cyclotransferase